MKAIREQLTAVLLITAISTTAIVALSANPVSK